MNLDQLLDTLVVPGFTRLGPTLRSRTKGWPADPAPDALRGQQIAVTGATSGLGEATARMLSDLGAHVHLIVRDQVKGRRVANELAGPTTVWRCDVSDLDSVRSVAADILAAGARFEGLIHNAGAMPPERTESAQGHEMTMALHLLGPVLLTELLLPALPGADVVFVTSGGMYLQRLRADDPEYLAEKYAGATAYARSKRAQVELLELLQERWQGHGIRVSATHPGWAATPGVTESLPAFDRVMKPLLRTPEQGADTTLWLLATDASVPAAKLWHDRQPRPIARGKLRAATPAQRQRMLAWVLQSVDLPETPYAVGS